MAQTLTQLISKTISIYQKTLKKANKTPIFDDIQPFTPQLLFIFYTTTKRKVSFELSGV